MNDQTEDAQCIPNDECKTFWLYVTGVGPGLFIDFLSTSLLP